MDSLIRNQGEIGLWVVIVGGLYLAAILVPLTARASWRSGLLLGSGFFSKLLSGLLFSIGGIAFNLAVLLLVVAAAGVWLLQPVPRLYDVQPVRVVRSAPGNDRLILYVGGWRGDGGDRLVQLMAQDPKLAQADILAVDYADLLARREPRLITLAQAMHPAVHGAITDPKYRSVVLIGHGIGGLLARWWAAPEGGGKASPVRALLDLAVPKRGADLAALATALGLPPALLGEVNDEAGFAGAAQRRWRALEPTAGGAYCAHGDADQAVPRDSALHGCARRDDVIGADHRGIASPLDREALSYRRPATLTADALAR